MIMMKYYWILGAESLRLHQACDYAPKQVHDIWYDYDIVVDSYVVDGFSMMIYM